MLKIVVKKWIAFIFVPYLERDGFLLNGGIAARHPSGCFVSLHATKHTAWQTPTAITAELRIKRPYYTGGGGGGGSRSGKWGQPKHAAITTWGDARYNSFGMSQPITQKHTENLTVFIGSMTPVLTDKTTTTKIIAPKNSWQCGKIIAPKDYPGE